MVLPLASPLMAQTAPPAGFSFGIALGPGWSSNPLDVPGRTKGDASMGGDIALRYRWNLWQDAGLTLGVAGFSEFFARESAGGFHRLVGSATFSQRWQGFALSLGLSARTSTNQHLTRHDSAHQDLSASLSRAITLAPGLTLTPAASFGRRFYQDGSEDQARARFSLTLLRKWDKWSIALAGHYGWALEDKTTVLPRINDRSHGVAATLGYEWEKDRDLALKLAYTRTLSSYQPNRTRALSLAPQVSATFRF